MRKVFYIDELIKKLLDATDRAAIAAEVPVASMICEPVEAANNTKDKEYRILSLTANRIRRKEDPTAHSEILALRKACSKKRTERLTNCIMITTLEPCLMCTGAIILARLKSVYYMATTQKGPGMSWIMSQAHPGSSRHLNHYPNIVHLQEQGRDYKKLLQAFFRERRSFIDGPI